MTEPEDRIVAALMPAMTYGLSHGATDAEHTSIFRDIETGLGADMRAFWTPTRDNFFSRVPAAMLETIYAALFDLAPDSEDAREFGRMKKGAKANLLHMLFNGDDKTRRAYRLMTDAALERIRTWVPAVD